MSFPVHIFTTDFPDNSESCFLQKFSGDSVITRCIWDRQDKECRVLVNNFVEWAEYNHLLLNVDKTRKLMLDLRRNKAALQALCILAKDIRMTEDCNTWKLTLMAV